MLIHNKDDIEFVTEFPCLLGHPVQYYLCTTDRAPNFCGKSNDPRAKDLGKGHGCLKNNNKFPENNVDIFLLKMRQF